MARRRGLGKLSRGLGLALCAVLVSAGLASAEGGAGPRTRGALEFSVLGGGYFFDNKKYDNGFFLGGRLGYWWTEAFSTELGWDGLDTEWDDTGKDASWNQVHLDLLYHFGKGSPLRPYLVLGGGFANQNAPTQEGIDTDIAWTYGAGIKYFLTPWLAARADLRQVAVFDRDDKFFNEMVSVGLSVVLGTKPAPAAAAPLDSDGDGVADNLDRCPGTPRGTPVDANGCPKDSDGDGVADNLDRCPGTPPGTPVDANGCPKDSDGDGVADNLDRCPGTPRGTPVDANGCPRDSDGDGVADAEDECPDTPRGAPVDRKGCLKDSDGDGLTDWDETQKYRTDPNNPDSDGDRLSDGREVLKLGTDPLRVDTDGGSVADGVEVLDNHTNPLDASDDVPEVETVELRINFDFDSAEIKPRYYPEIEKVAEFLKAHPDYNVIIEGHTDSMGTEEYNIRLSARRANAVAKVLTDRYGISPDRITVQSLGESRPIAPNDTEEGRAQNRRIYAYMEKAE